MYLFVGFRPLIVTRVTQYRGAGLPNSVCGETIEVPYMGFCL